jgi:diguanylate cyclase (GGDEF)-like protein
VRQAKLKRSRVLAVALVAYWGLLLLLSLAFWPSASSAQFLLPLVVLAGLPFVILVARALVLGPQAGGSDLAFRDDLTGLSNRRAFRRDAAKLLKGAKSGRIGLVLIDVDRLKLLNDECGHQAGDELLTHVANHLHRTGGALYRIGGDEFAVLVERDRGTSMTGVLRLLEPHFANFISCRHEHEVCLSFGSTSNRLDEGFDAFFKRADELLLNHKRQLYRSGRLADRRVVGIAPAATAVGHDEDRGRPHLRLLD